MSNVKKSNIMSRFLLTVSMFLSLAFLNVACDNEEFNEASQDGAVEVSFVVDVDALTSTRAISDGTGATQLMYAVFDENDQVIIPKVVMDNVSTLLSDKGFDMTISLPKGNVYRVVFWAQNPNCTAYSVSDDMKVTIDYTGINNDELRDAFYAYTEQFKVENVNSTIFVVLKRPFAQVNVGAFPFDMEHAQDGGVDVTKSSASIKAVPNSINLLDGTTEGMVDIEYSFSAKPSEELLVDVDEDGTDEEYDYLSMSYLLANPEGTLHEMSFIFTNEDETKQVEFKDGLETVPVKRNWRTNIVGQILTGNVAFNIKVDPVYDGDTINSGGLHYSFSEDTEIKDKVFAFNTNEWATFTSENNSLLTFENVTFSGAVQYIAFGDYMKRDGKVVVPFRNSLTNVVAKDMVVTHSKGITNVEPIDYMAPLIFLRGESTITDCVFTGATCKEDLLYEDYWGDYHEVLPYDCGVPNDCNAMFTGCTIGRMYAWSHSQVTIENSKVDYIRCSTHNQTKPDAHLTIGAGAEVGTIVVTSSGMAKRYKDENGKTHWDPNNMWAPSLIIKAGATVDVLDMNGRSRYDSKGNLDVVIEEGAIVKQILNEDVPAATE